jgi:hypothetical protein
MHHLRLLILALTIVMVLAFAALALVVGKSDQSLPIPGDDVIIIKGGSLTIQCPNNTDCLDPSDGKGKYPHKGNKDEGKPGNTPKKIKLIVVKDESGRVLGSFSDVNYPNGKASVEITYK